MLKEKKKKETEWSIILSHCYPATCLTFCVIYICCDSMFSKAKSELRILWIVDSKGSTCLSFSRAGEWGRRGVEWPELGGEGEARVEDVMEEGIKLRPVLSLPSDVGGMGGLSKAMLTLLSISSARNSVLSFSSWISLEYEKRLVRELLGLKGKSKNYSEILFRSVHLSNVKKNGMWQKQ